MPGRRRYRTRRRVPRYAPKRALHIFRAAACAICLLSCILLLDARLRPGIRAIAALQGRNLAVTSIHDCITQTLLQEDIGYADLVHISETADGMIRAIETDVARVNALQATLVNSVNARIAEMNATRLQFPLGSASGISIFSGRGPKIGVKVAITGTAQASFDNVFDSAGINQTQHRIMMEVRAQVYMLLAGNESEEEVCVQVCVAETIIVGVVPDIMARLSGQ